MQFDEHIYDQIQKFLDKEMTEEELRNFQEESDANEALASEVGLNREMKDFLADTPENELRKNLQILNQRVTTDPNGTPFPWKYFLWAMPLFIIGAFWFFNLDNDEPEIAQEAPLGQVEEATNVLQDSVKEENIIVPEEITPLQEEPPAPALPEKKTKKEKPNSTKPKDTPRPIAGNFEPNPSLEFYIGNNLRDNFELVVEQKQANAKITSENEDVNFQIALLLKTEKDLSNNNYKLYIFSNDKAAFSDFSPISTDDLTINKIEEGAYRIAFQKTIKLMPGLYYYMLEDAATEKINLVEKFEVN